MVYNQNMLRSNYIILFLHFKIIKVMRLNFLNFFHYFSIENEIKYKILLFLLIIYIINYLLNHLLYIINNLTQLRFVGVYHEYINKHLQIQYFLFNHFI